MSNSKIDKTQPYASVCNDDLGRVFEQNNKFYDAGGNEWTDYSQPDPAKDEPALVAKPVAQTRLAPAKAPAKAAPVKAAPAPAKAAPAKAAVPDTDDQLAAQLAGESAV